MIYIFFQEIPWFANEFPILSAQPTQGDVLAKELGRDVALEFCSASRFSLFVQTIVTRHELGDCTMILCGVYPSNPIWKLD